MDIRNHRALKQQAREAMAVAREPKKVILAYAGILTLTSLVLTLVNLYLNNEISGSGGLANLGIRSILSTIQMVLPLAQTVILLCLELGYLSAAMRFARKQYADHTDLRTGFQRFGPLLRMVLLEGAIYLGILFVCCYIGTQIFLVTPLAAPLVELLTPMLESSMLGDTGAIAMDSEIMLAMYDAMAPIMVITMVIFAVVAIPIAYRYRMANYRLLDKPQEGAIAALRSSWRMMKGNALSLFKLDLSFWWFYLLTALASVVCYGDQLLPLLGIALPIPAMASYLLFYALYLALQFAIYYYFRNHLEVTYVMAYEAIRPQEQTGGAILGNIFNM